MSWDLQRATTPKNTLGKTLASNPCNFRQLERTCSEIPLKQKWLECSNVCFLKSCLLVIDRQQVGPICTRTLSLKHVRKTWMKLLKFSWWSIQATPNDPNGAGLASSCLAVVGPNWHHINAVCRSLEVVLSGTRRRLVALHYRNIPEDLKHLPKLRHC
jgi:hypothetical protein